jgi:hypothetical protein
MLQLATGVKSDRISNSGWDAVRSAQLHYLDGLLRAWRGAGPAPRASADVGSGPAFPCEDKSLYLSPSVLEKPRDLSQADP